MYSDPLLKLPEIAQPPFLELLGARCLRAEAESGQAELQLNIDERHINLWQVTHGGVSMTLLDSAMGHAGRTLFPQAGASITVEMKTTFIRPGGRPGQTVRAVARVLHRTSTLCFCEAELLVDDAVAAKASGTFKYPRKRSRFPVRAPTPLQALPVQVGYWAELSRAASSVRQAVFVAEQGVPEVLERDSADPLSLHALVRDAGGAPIATGRLLPDGHIGRMAVVRSARGQGVGRKVLNALVEAGRQRGHAELILSAQVHAAEFYRRAGFVERGEAYLEAGIPHIGMVLQTGSGGS